MLWCWMFVKVQPARNSISRLHETPCTPARLTMVPKSRLLDLVAQYGAWIQHCNYSSITFFRRISATYTFLYKKLRDSFWEGNVKEIFRDMYVISSINMSPSERRQSSNHLSHAIFIPRDMCGFMAPILLLNSWLYGYGTSLTRLNFWKTPPFSQSQRAIIGAGMLQTIRKGPWPRTHLTKIQAT